MTEEARLKLAEAARLIDLVLQRIGVDGDDEVQLRLMVAQLREIASRREGRVRYEPMGSVA